MISLRSVFPAICLLSLIVGLRAGPVFADSSAEPVSGDTSHARIVRLSLVQGDVRFARDLKGDPLADAQGDWEAAVLNLPIRQGYVVATDNGRTEVEFENGAMAFLAENTVLEFYDLSSEDGGFTTRLILRQGSAEFYVNPARGDYFSVTGGDFSVQADTRTTFRMNNFDDGSNVSVLHGRLTALANGKNTPVAKGQSLSLKAGDPGSMQVDRASDSDEFDQWVSGRIESVNTATSAAMQYSNQYSDASDYSSGYTSGYADLYTYGGWFPVAGYGSCWRPYGVGLGWSPFDSGSWFYDSAFGWSFIGGQPWGWLPYHYGGWLFRPGLGWVWSPSSNFGGGSGLGRWRPVTGTWMRSAGGVAIVPSHPQDSKGKTPLNLSSGLFAVTTRGVSGQVAVENGQRWKVESKPARDVMQNQLATATAPVRVSRTMAAGGANTDSSGSATGDHQSTIIYDRTERKFVNSNSSGSTTRTASENPGNANGASGSASQGQGRAQVRTFPEPNKTGTQAPVPPSSHRAVGREGANTPVPSARSTAPMPSRPAVTPPNVPRAVTSERVFSGGGPRGGAAAGSSAGAAAGSAAAPRASSPAPSAPSAGSAGGGRPH